MIVLVVLNRIARSVVERRRGKHAKYVFTFKGMPLRCMLNSGLDARRGCEQGCLRFGSTTSSTPSVGAFGRAA